jgi:hypothetical protein
MRPAGWLLPHVTQRADLTADVRAFAAEHPVLAHSLVSNDVVAVTVMGTGEASRLTAQETADLAFLGYTLGAAHIRARTGAADGFDTNFERGLELGGGGPVIDIAHVAIAADDAAFVRFADAFCAAVNPEYDRLPEKAKVLARYDIAQVLARDAYAPSKLFVYVADESGGVVSGSSQYATYLWRCLKPMGRPQPPQYNLRTERDFALASVIALANEMRTKAGKMTLAADWGPDNPQYHSQIDASILMKKLRANPETQSLPIRWLANLGNEGVPIEREGKVVAFRLIDSNEIIFVDERQTKDRPISVTSTSYHLGRNANGVLEAYRKLKT